MVRCRVKVSIMACDQGTYREGNFLDVSDSVMAMFEREHIAEPVIEKHPKAVLGTSNGTPVKKGKGGKK